MTSDGYKSYTIKNIIKYVMNNGIKIILIIIAELPKILNIKTFIH